MELIICQTNGRKIVWGYSTCRRGTDLVHRMRSEGTDEDMERPGGPLGQNLDRLGVSKFRVSKFGEGQAGVKVRLHGLGLRMCTVISSSFSGPRCQCNVRS